MLLDRRLLEILAQRLDIGRNVQRLDIGDLADLVMVALGEEPLRGPVIGHAGIFVADGGGEEFEEAAGGLPADAITRGTRMPQVDALGLGAPAFVFATVPSGGLFADLAELIAPQGRLALINGEAGDVSIFMRKSVSVHYELMFTRPLFQTADIEAQHRLLNEVADLVEPGRVRSTMSENYGRIDAANLMRAMAFLKSGRAIGKIVLSGF